MDHRDGQTPHPGAGSGGSTAHPLRPLRCRQCGDTFTSHEEAVACPTCGSGEVDPAWEPLL